MRIIVNVTYSYAIIITAAKCTQESEKYKNEKTIENSRFSHKWVKGFLERGGVRRRKITKEDKVTPTDDEIRRILKIGQDIFISKGHGANTCFNFDETAFTYAIGPTHVFCPGDQQRATNLGISNDKLRITAVIAVNGNGIFAPLMLIIKHSVSSEVRPDQTRMRVIHELFKKEGFTNLNGWSIKIWQKELTIKSVTAIHKCTYIIHQITGHVITSQCKAWNDTIRMVMWYELVMHPIKTKLGKMLLWCDNCGSHRTSSVRDTIHETGIDVAFLPPNMTSELQVLDLVVNGPIKSHIKNKRAERLYDSFQKYKLERMADADLPSDQRTSPDFLPPKPSMNEGMQDLISLFDDQFTHEKFKKCINASFISTGTLPYYAGDDCANDKFMIYAKSQASGTLPIVPQGTLEMKSDVTEDNSETQQENIERALFLYFVENNESHEEDSDGELSDGESS